MAKDVLHVVPHDQAWAVRREGNERVSSTHPTQKDAIEAARELARELDDIVIHRPDGTIRERVTYIGSHDQGNGRTNGGARTAAEGVALDPRDVASVGSRVSWEAVVAGAVVALAAYFALTLLALAVGLSTIDRATPKSFATGAAVVSGIILLACLFLGGFVASRATAGEQPREGVIYGVLVWGTTLLLLGTVLGLGFAGAVRTVAAATDPALSADRVKQDLRLSDQQAELYAAKLRDTQGAAGGVGAQEAAWWAFAAAVLSLVAAVGGGWVGAGPPLVLRRAGDTPAVAAVQPRPA
jgi:hypothetical protein